LKKTIQISVRTLVEYVFRSGDLGFEFLGSNRSAEGIQAHRKIQRSRPDEYSSEVPLVHRIETDHFILEISGRMDGIYQYPDRVIIEEIKTTATKPEVWETEENHVHWGQLKCYAYIYAVEYSLEKIDTQLTYYHTKTGKTKEFRRHFSREELEHFFQELISRYLEWTNTIEEWNQIRDHSILNLDFPFPAYRAGQRKMAVDVYLTIKRRNQLIVQAPTGIGKTIATLFPAIKALREGHTSKMFYLTARTTGRVAAENALDELRRKGLRIKSLTITAKEKICFHPAIFCNPDECPCAGGYFDRITQAVQEVFQQDALTREAIEDVARKHNVCPFEFSLDLSLWADCIICDYNYAFDPRVYLKRFFLEGKGEYTFLIDEAHNLVDRAREMFSAEIRKQPFLDLRRVVRNQLPDLYKIMGKINTWLLQARKQCDAKGGEPYAEKSPPEDLLPLLKDFVEEAENWLTLNLKTPFRKELLDVFFEASRFITVAEQYDEQYATCFEKINSDLRVKLFCLDPSERLKDALKRCQAAIFFSATMTPAAYFQKILGCNESARTRILPSPFPRENLCLLISGNISTLYKQRAKTVPAVTQAILAMVQQKKGNYLLFFPSYQYMEMVYESFSEECPDIEIILQTRGMTEREREIFLERFAHDNEETLVGFAVMGGIFGEGIDLVGDRLTGAVIVGVGLPGISLERDLIRDYFTHSNGAGFEYAYMYPGINRVFQAAGRVIRTEYDRGAVLLIDQRFSTFRYTSLFPCEWHPIRVKEEEHIRALLQEFWNQEPS
jgi:DNA excision repair protein ERCC-2